MSNDPVVAIVGVTGAVGAEFIATMDKRGFRVGKLKALASARSAGKTVSFRGQDVVIEELTERAFEGVDIALFSAGGSISKKYAPIAVKAGAVVVDNSSAFRMDPNVPLVIPEINANRIRDHKGIIANPNCAAITALVPLWPIHQTNRIRRVIISTYQAASGAGAAAMDELVESTRANLNGQVYTPKVMPHPYAFNLFNHNTAVDPETGYNDEETKVINETRKIFEDETIAIGVTCVRVPVLRAHCEAITFECEKPITEDQVRAIMAQAPGVKIVDDRAKNNFPMPIDASGQDDVLVGRIRKDLSDPSGHSISMFVAADQLLKGAALNAVQIAELLPGNNAVGSWRVVDVAEEKSRTCAAASPCRESSLSSTDSSSSSVLFVTSIDELLNGDAANAVLAAAGYNFRRAPAFVAPILAQLIIRLQLVSS